MQLLAGVGVTTLSWLMTALVTPPTDPAGLDRFYARVRPAGPGWRPVAARVGPTATAAHDAPDASRPWLAPLIATIASTLSIWAALFAAGHFLYGHAATAALLTAVAVVGALVVRGCWPRLEFR